MRRLAVAFGLLTLTAHSASAQQLARDAGLAEVADRFDQAQLQKNKTLLDQMVSEDLVFITGAGQRQGKREFIAGWTGPDETYSPIVLTDRKIIPLGPDAGLVTAETVLSGTSRGKSFANRIRFTDTFRRLDGRWQAVHIQVTRIPD